LSLQTIQKNAYLIFFKLVVPKRAIIVFPNIV
jgi:hypothetical protein